MRVNEPITQKEVDYSSDIQLITTTDPRGIITFVNDEFCKVSGFSRAELVGQNHNIIRHPDMPEGAFKDLWSTVQAGNSWKGMVKNRCKNGDHYWVDAFVSPIMQNGKIIEYQSVRQRPDAASRKRAEAVYSAWKAQGELPRFLTRPNLSLVNRQSLVIGFPFILLSLLAAVFFGWLPALITLITTAMALAFSQFSFGSLHKLTEDAKKIASSRAMRYIYTGNLTEVGLIHYSLKTRTSELRAVASRMNNSSLYLTRSKDRADDLMHAANQAVLSQKHEVGLVSQSMLELRDSLEEVSSSSARTAEAAAQSQQATLKGRDLIKRMMQGIQSLAVILEDSSNKVEALASQTNRIGKMTEVISDVAEQTNLLALNAAIEAARAGEAGRGFAVVADEVRNLAKRTHDSTAEITGIIQGLVDDTHASVSAIRKGTEASKETVRVAEETDTALGTILSAVSRINDLVVQVDSAISTQQSISDATQAQIERLDASSDQAAASSHLARQESVKLGNHIEGLKTLAGHFITSLNQQNQA